MAKKKRPDFKVIQGGKPEPEPTPTVTVTYDTTFENNRSVTDILSEWESMLFTQSLDLTSDSFFMSFHPAGDTLTGLVTSNGKRPVDANTWTELANLVDRWRAAQDEFTLVALNRELKDWLDRR